jgi:anhydro-N-acetylmuramic acid kinase
MKTYRVAGIMSGTSLDGLDLALCRFTLSGKGWTYSIEKAATIPYSDLWFRRLGQAHTLDAHSFLLLHKDFGRFMGEQVNAFLDDSKRPDLVASHGHTVFHAPSQGLTFQIGDGATLAAECGITTVCDFRSLDVALGGQGAPLVPAGDEILFGNYDFCLNLGGFANISFRKNNRRIAYDICPVNALLNHLSRKLGLPFDRDGEAGRSGKIIDELILFLDSVPYYQASPPKSLGREWLEQEILPRFNTEMYPVPDLLRTAYQHAATQIASNLFGDPSSKVLVTGGGAYNRFLLERIRENTLCNLVLPDDFLIRFKEALIFAFLGVLRMRNDVNCLSSVTGARQDSSSGIVYGSSRPWSGERV